jgi:hypothetical protein
MNEFRLLFQIFLIFVLFSGIYVIFWVHKYSESFTEGLTDTPAPAPAQLSATTTTSEEVVEVQDVQDVQDEVDNTPQPLLLPTPTSAPSTNLSNAYAIPDASAPESGSLNANKEKGLILNNSLITQKQYSVPGSAANALPAQIYDSSSDAAEVNAPTDNKSYVAEGIDENTQSEDSGVGDDSNTGEQNLDDYVLNQNSVTIQPLSSSETNRETAQQAGNTSNADFLPSTVAYPQSPYGPFDPLSQDINNYQYVAKGFMSSQPTGLSDNPMDPNWGGVKYTQDIIKSGKYNDNNITRPLLFQPKGLYIDAVPSAFGKPQDKLV